MLESKIIFLSFNQYFVCLFIFSLKVGVCQKEGSVFIIALKVL